MSSLKEICRFRVNSRLKNDFSDICKSNHTSISSELRSFLKRSILSRILSYNSAALVPNQSTESALSAMLSKDKKTTLSVVSSSDYQEDFELDTTCNFKVEDGLKSDFMKTFPGTSISSELKRFMSHIVKSSK